MGHGTERIPVKWNLTPNTLLSKYKYLSDTYLIMCQFLFYFTY